MKAFDSILIANRGEIAMRIMRTAHRLGYRTVAVYSEADRDLPHARFADKAVCIGAAAAADSYLAIERVLDAARVSGAEAVHPGYGFLSENEGFAKACEAAGLTFIGPPPEAIRQMGDKAVAKRLMLEAGVPCIPGYDGQDQAESTFAREARRIGYPVMVKAIAGGGGKGIRLVENDSLLAEAVRLARSEAERSFGNGQLMLEKAVLKPRHVEVQVFADNHGDVVHIGDRDCSIQRRHQKVIEEAPAPRLPADVRDAMGRAAVKAALAVHYRGAGTVEFLVDQRGEFYFLEMNTRLQVEHPVTEMVTDLDLVEWQIRVAQGEPLPLPQSRISVRGHAMEARLYAEDPAADFLPQSGRIEHWQPPSGDGIRVDHALRQGATISTWYDPMIAKVIAVGTDREEARRRLVRALTEQVVVGLPNNRQFLLACLTHPEFVAERLSTDFIERNVSDVGQPSAPTDAAIALAAVMLWTRSAAAQPEGLRGWRSTGWTDQPLPLRCGSWKSIVRLSKREDVFEVQSDGKTIVIQLIEEQAGSVRVGIDGVDRDVQHHHLGEASEIILDGIAYEFAIWKKVAGSTSDDAQPSARAPMPGVVTSVRVKPGDDVARGDVLLTMEAMKMEMAITSPSDGNVLAIHCTVGQQVPLRYVLADIQPKSVGQ